MYKRAQSRNIIHNICTQVFYFKIINIMYKVYASVCDFFREKNWARVFPRVRGSESG